MPSPTTKSDEVIKSSVEDLVPIPSESEGIPNNMRDVLFCDNSPSFDISKDQFKDFFDSKDDSTLIDDDYFSIDNIDYVEASPPNSELVSLEEYPSLFPILVEDSDSFFEKSDTSLSYSDNSLPEFVTFSDHMEETKPHVHVPNVLPTHPTLMLDLDFIPSDNSLPKFEIFYFDIKEKNNGSTTIHADISLLGLEFFYFKSEPDLGELTSIVDSGIRENVLFATNVNLSPEDDQSPLFTYVVWILLPFLTYPVAPPYLLSFRNEDTIFDLGISSYHFSSLESGVSHRSRYFIKFNVYPKPLE
nr:hypothetical protein [Tanacetum cinerariifolium]